MLQAQQRQAELADSIADTETSLAQVLGFNPGDRVQPAQEERRGPARSIRKKAPSSKPLNDNREIQRLESNLQAKNLEIKSYKAERFPRSNLMAQYSLLSRYQQLREVFRAIPAPQL